MFIQPTWPAPSHIKAYSTTRHGGVSQPPYHGFNLGHHVGDNPLHVQKNRRHLMQQLQLPAEPLWLEQVHGTHVIRAEKDSLRQADACYAVSPQHVCVVLTADCLPILLTDQKGSCVAAIHAGWRGLHQGIIESVVEKLPVSPEQILAWLGPAIGPMAFEVGEEVMSAFTHALPITQDAFIPKNETKWLANIYQLATHYLHHLGITAIYTEPFCTYQEPERFFSYRREQTTGRMASLIWISP